mmetsp:Transcript_118123/g.335077  ORF Transcript_118123/g.335077 Transcript_118123/m.335077 type:complete len:405 (+) Transcript_118123:422-1636(+)
MLRGLVARDFQGVVGVHLLEELLALLPGGVRELAEERPLREHAEGWMNRVAVRADVLAVGPAVRRCGLPVDPRGAVHELVDLVQDVLFFVTTRTDLHPEGHKLLCVDAPVVVDVNRVEHLVHTHLAEGPLEELCGLVPRDFQGAADVHFVEQLLAPLPRVGRELAEEGPLREPVERHVAPVAAAVVALGPVDPHRPTHQLVDLIDDVLLPVAARPHPDPEGHELLGRDRSVVVHVHLVEHLVRADVAERPLEELHRLLARDHLAAVGVHLAEELLALLPRVVRELAQEWPLREGLETCGAGARLVLPTHPGGPPQKLVDFVKDLLLLVAGCPHLQPEDDELVRCDGPALVDVYLVEHRVGADVREGPLEEGVGLFSRDRVAAVRVHHAEELLDRLPGVGGKLAC